MHLHEHPSIIKYRYKPWVLCSFLLAISASSHAAKQPFAGASSEQEIQKIIEHISDEELKYFMQELSSTGQNPYPEIEDLDIWLLKAIEEPQHALQIVQYLEEKGLLSKSLPWFSKVDKQATFDFPMHRVAFLGKVEILAFLLEKGVTKYDSDRMFTLALKGGSIDMIRFLLKKQIFDKKKLYGSFPSVIPQVLTIVFFGCIVPLAIFGIHRYGWFPLHTLVYQYLPIASFAIAILTLLYLLMNMPKEDTEGIGYLHVLSTLSVKDDQDGRKAENIAAIAEILILYGANPNQRGSYIQKLGFREVQKMEDFTPLHGAVKRGNLALVKTLIYHGAHVNALAVLKKLQQDDPIGALEDGNFVLYLPFWGSIEGEVLNVYTPLDFAVLKDQDEVYDYLIKLKGTQRAQRRENLLNLFPA